MTVSDLEKIHGFCKASAYKTGDLRGLSGDTTTYLFVTDPDGYRIEVQRAKYFFESFKCKHVGHCANVLTFFNSFLSLSAFN